MGNGARVASPRKEHPCRNQIPTPDLATSPSVSTSATPIRPRRLTARWESKSPSSEPLHAIRRARRRRAALDPHHALNTPVGEPDPDADSDPYRTPTADDDEEHASGTRGSGQGAEDR